jgi:hypothetical protein
MKNVDEIANFRNKCKNVHVNYLQNLNKVKTLKVGLYTVMRK